MIPAQFVILGAIISLSGSLQYAWHTIQGKTQPNRVTWFLWAAAPMIAFFAMLDEGVGWVALMTFSVGFGPLLIFLASFVNKDAVWKMTRFDYVCGATSVFALVLWMITKDAQLAIALSLGADFIAFLPTLVKGWKAPQSESSFVFFCACLNSAIALLTITVWEFAEYAFPVYIFICCAAMFCIIQFSLGPKIMKINISKPA